MATTIEKVYKLEVQGTDSINDLKSAIEQLNEKLKTLNATSQEYKETLEQLTELQGKLAEAMEKISESAESTSESIENIKDSIEEVADVVEGANEALEGFGNVDSGVIDAFVEGIMQGISEAADGVDGLTENIENLGDINIEVNVDVPENSVEEISQSLENLGDVDVNVNVNVDDGSIDAVKDQLENLDDVEVKVDVVAEDSSIDELKDNLESIEDATVKVDVVTDDSSIDTLKKELNNIEDADVKVNVETDESSIDTLTTTLDSLEDVDIDVNVKTDESQIENLSTTLESLEDTDVSVTVDVNEDTLDNLTTTLDGLEDTTVSVNVTTDEGSVEDLKETLENIEDVNVTVGVEVDDSSLDNLTTTLENVEDVNINVGVEVSDEQLDSLSEDITNITTDFESLNSEAEKTSETLGNIGGASTVKELKQQISDLRDRLVTLDKGSEEYKATVQQLIDAQVKLKEVMNAGKNEMQAAEGSYNALSQRMSALKQVWKETTDEATRNEIGKQINEINNQLKALDSSIGNSQRNVGNYKSALEGLDAEYITQKQELKELKIAMEQMDPATQEYADAMARAAELTHNLSDQQEMIKLSSADVGDQLSNVRGIASNLAAGYSAVNSAMGLFGGENEEVAQALLKVQQAMALVQGMQGIDGFIKRTKGLSQSMGLVTKATQANTVATKANAAASKADAVAKGAEAVATKAAVPAQLSLNAAMEANPIGFIVGLIATLVTAMMLLKDKIMEMIGANEGMSKAFDKVKAVFAGFGNVIKKSVINPIKMAIIPIKTLAKVMIDLFNGDWSKIGDDFKEGMKEMKDTAIDTINVVGAFKEGYDKKTAEQAEAARKKSLEESKKKLEGLIKDNEAKYDSDWKYTEEGKKLYTEYFETKKKLYAEDTDEYKEALREQWAYEREITKKKEQDSLNELNLNIKLNEAKYGSDWKYTQKGRDAYNEYFDKKQAMYAEDSQEYKEIQIERENFDADQRKHSIQEYENNLKAFRSAFDKYMPEWTKIGFELDDIEKQWEDGVNQFRTYLIKTKKMTVEEAENIINLTWNDLQTKLWNDVFGKQWNSELEKKFYQWERTSKNFIEKIEQQFNFDKITSGAVVSLGKLYGFTRVTTEEEIQHIEVVYKNTRDRILKEQEELQKTINKMYDNAMDDLRVFLNMEIPEGSAIKKWFDDAQEYLLKYKQALASGNKEAAEQYQLLGENLRNSLLEAAKGEGDFGEYVRSQLDESLGTLLSEYQKMLDQMNDLDAEYTENELDKIEKISDARMDAYENELNAMKFAYEQEVEQRTKKEELRQAELETAEEYSLNTANFLERPYKKERELIEENRQLTVQYYTDLFNKYLEMSQNMELTAEERENAIREANNATLEIAKANADAQIEMQKSMAKGWKTWVDSIKSTLSSVGTIVSTMSDYYTGLMELEEERIDQMLESGEISQEEAEKRYEEQKDNFEKAKAFQIAETVINGLTGAISAYQSMASIPYVGPFLGAAAAAAVAALTAVNVAKIKATTMDNPYSSSSSSSGGGTNFTLPDVLETEPQYLQNQTNMNDTDELNNDGTGGRGDNGGGEKAVRAYVVESDVSASQELARKRSNEVTF